MDGSASDVVVVSPEHAGSGISMAAASAVWRNEDKYRNEEKCMEPLP